MILHNEFDQGSGDWYAARLGKPTASEFHRIITPATGKLSAQHVKYSHRLVAEILLNRPLETIEGLEWIERGKEMEPEAVRLYEAHTETQTKTIGFITTDDSEIGCSPDRLVGDNGLAEIKCPAPQTMIGYLLDGFDKDYRPQVQGQLYVSEREWVDFWAYHPEFPPLLIRVERDEPYIALLKAALNEFVDKKNEMVETIRAKGFFLPPKEVMIPGEHEYRDELAEALAMGRA